MMSQQNSGEIWKVVMMVCMITGGLGLCYALYGAYQLLNADAIATAKAQEAAGFLGGLLVGSIKSGVEESGKTRFWVGGIAALVSYAAYTYAKQNAGWPK